MFAVLLDAPGVAPFARPDWTSLGLVLQILGCFLLANAILFRNPRAMVAERLGHAPRQLRHLREFIFQRVQMGIGFLFLSGGLAAQLFGHGRPATGEGGSPVMWIGLVVVFAVVLEVAGWWWSVRSLRRHVRAFLRDNPPEFETDPNLAREIGELYGIASRADETVQSYAARLRQELKLAPAARGPARARGDERRPFAPKSVFGEESDAGFEDG